MEAKTIPAKLAEQPYERAWERLYTAVRTLAIGRGSIQERLTVAFTSELHQLCASDRLPAPYQQRFDALYAKATREGSITDTVIPMSDADASKLAAEVFSLYADFDRSHRRWRAKAR